MTSFSEKMVFSNRYLIDMWMPNFIKKYVPVSNLDVFVTLLFIFQPRLPSAGDPRRPNTKIPVEQVWPLTWKLLSRDTKALLDTAAKAEAEKDTKRKSAVKTCGSMIKGGASKRSNSAESSVASSSVTNHGAKNQPSKKVLSSIIK